ncbi:MAG: dCTP deaminase [Oscillospiraceae bacterium]
MILSGKEIVKQIELGNIEISDFDFKCLNPNSYNLRLHDKLLVYENNLLDMKSENKCTEIIIPDDGLILNPGTLYLGRTLEKTTTKTFVPMLEGRSSVGRLGLYIHVTAGFGDVGFSGYWTLEIHCVQPIKIYKNVELCQIYYHTIQGEYDEYKSGKYQNNESVQPSMMYKDFIK